MSLLNTGNSKVVAIGQRDPSMKCPIIDYIMAEHTENLFKVKF